MDFARIFLNFSRDFLFFSPSIQKYHRYIYGLYWDYMTFMNTFIRIILQSTDDSELKQIRNHIKQNENI